MNIMSHLNSQIKKKKKTRNLEITYFPQFDQLSVVWLDLCLTNKNSRHISALFSLKFPIQAMPTG